MTKAVSKLRGVLAAAGLTVALSASAVAAPNCTCRYGGEDYDLGNCICMQTPNGSRLSCCDMVLNNTSWTFSEGGCPIVSLDPSSGEDRTAGMSVAANPPLEDPEN